MPAQCLPLLALMQPLASLLAAVALCFKLDQRSRQDSCTLKSLLWNVFFCQVPLECLWSLLMNWLIVQGDSADSMLQWVLSQRGPESIKDPDLAKQVTLAVLRHAIPSPKVHLPTATYSVSAPGVTIKAYMLCNCIRRHTDKACSLQKHQASQAESSGMDIAQAQTRCSRASTASVGKGSQHEHSLGAV